MRNYFKALEVPTTTSQKTFDTLLRNKEEVILNIKDGQRFDAISILLDENRLELYASTAQLYETMHLASSSLTSTDGKDTHHWQERLVDFYPSEEELIDLLSTDV